MDNKEFKINMLDNGIFKNIKHKKRELYNEFKNDFEEEPWLLYEVIEENLKLSCSDLEYKCYSQMIDAQKHQQRKIKEHIRYWLQRSDYKLFFVTYTFNDDYLARTKPSTRKRKIIELLKAHGIQDYIVNVDYGTENDREHYHALIVLNRYYLEYLERITLNDFKFKPYEDMHISEKVGFYTFRLVNVNVEDNEDMIAKLSKYMTKLILHSVKVKQSYLSVKKGSDFQKYKNLTKELKRYNFDTKNYHVITKAKKIRDNIKANMGLYND